MRVSQYFLPLLKEDPKEAQIISHRTMLRAGMIKQQAAGIYSTFAIGGLVAPLFTGLLADRYVASERFLAVLHLLMAGLMTVAGWW